MDQDQKMGDFDKLETAYEQSDAINLGFAQRTVALVEEGEIDPLYHAKAQVLNDAIQEIGMGKYQWHLFCVAGFGWLSDNVLLIVVCLSEY